MHSVLLTLSGLLFFNILLLTSAKCPTLLPIEIDGRCYSFQTDPRLKFKDAADNCPKKNEKATIVSIRSQAVFDEIRNRSLDFVSDKLEKAYFWMGLFMEDTARQKAAKDRNWKWSYDGTEIVQKEYKYWKKKDGPTNKGLACSAISPYDNYSVVPIDCSGPKIPLICLMKEGEPCKHSGIAYMMFGNYCIGTFAGALPYDKMRGACTPGEPTVFKEEMRNEVMTSAYSAFLGGGIFMNMIRGTDGKFRDLSDNWEPGEDWWDEGEPRNDYDCVGLTFLSDWSMKLKTMNCEFMASFVCVLND